ncbi:MAG: hypothetical protein R2856_05810 [Caldilineaceae bacterium]
MYTASFALAETAAALRSGEMDLLDYVDAVCDRIEAVEPHVPRCWQGGGSAGRLRQDARALLERYPARRPSLFGVLVGVRTSPRRRVPHAGDRSCPPICSRAPKPNRWRA